MNDIITNLKMPITSAKSSIVEILNLNLQKTHPEQGSELLEKFKISYETLIKEHEIEDTTDLAKFYRLIMQYKPALSTILEPGKEFDELCNVAVMNFNVTLNRVRSQLNEPKPKQLHITELKYCCTVCNKTFEIPPKKKKEIEDSEEKIKLPDHCGKEMIIKIVKSIVNEKNGSTKEITPIKIYPAELLMGHIKTDDESVEYLKILSVGIDVGSSTSHLIFSRLTLKREVSFFNMTNRFNLVGREIIYESKIIFTPLLDRKTIDIEKIIEFCKEEYKKAEIKSEMVDTGAVIVTGETAKKENAAEIVKRLSSESGKFVSASAGPNFESTLSIMGSGIVDYSRRQKQTIMNVDIGGGTSNIAIASNGNVLSTSCINVGGRLLGIDKKFKIWRIDEPTKWIMKELGMNYELGDIISKEDVLKITKEYAKALIEVMHGPAKSTIAKLLMMTEDIDIIIPIEGYSFSGGVAELIYGKSDKQTDKEIEEISNPYNDIGYYLALEIKNIIEELKIQLIEPENKIRATVIGAGAFSLSVSGSTCYCDEMITLPLENVPVVPINLDFKDLHLEGNEDLVKQKINIALKNFDLIEGVDTFALFFKDFLNPSVIVPFARSIERALPNSIIQNKMILIILGSDGGKMLGLTIKKETKIKNNILCLDELELEAGDWIDIGAPLQTKHRKAFPITIKSLVFNNNKGRESAKVKSSLNFNEKTEHAHLDHQIQSELKNEQLSMVPIEFQEPHRSSEQSTNTGTQENLLGIESTKLKIISIVKKVLEENFPDEISELMTLFTNEYENLIKKHEPEGKNNLLHYYTITTKYQPALVSILKSKENFNDIIKCIETAFDATLTQVVYPKNNVKAKKQPKIILKYYCSVCNQEFEIPAEEERMIKESDSSLIFPKHHGKEMILKIVKPGLEKQRNLPVKAEPEYLMHKKHERKGKTPENFDVNSLKVLSVGIDVGSSTSHLIFSRLTLRRELSYFNKTNQFKIVDREIIYEGDIIFTPLLDYNTIDIAALIAFFQKEYENAKITPDMIDTGAVIVTGETAKKENAAEIVKRLSSESGKFVSATAGPNFESTLGIMGAGMVDESKKLQQTIMNVDIGGGTSNIAIASNGTVLSTSCINIGGRLLGIDQEFKIWRMDKPTEEVMKILGMEYKCGDIIPERDVKKITKEYAKALIEVMRGPAQSPIAKILMMTDDININRSVDKYSFSGGVAEMIYNNLNKQELDDNLTNLNPYNDIGQYLAIEIKNLIEELQLPTIEPINKIRATVIGAGAFSLSVSGSTCYWDESIKLPINNIPIIPINIDYNKFFFEDYQDYMKREIEHALRNYNLIEGEDIFALYFKERLYQSAIVQFAKSIEQALPKSITANKLVLIILGEDGGKMLGLTIKRETSIKHNLMCIDELELEAGDWIDIGAPLNVGLKKAFPITKKSLIFCNK